MCAVIVPGYTMAVDHLIHAPGTIHVTDATPIRQVKK